MHSGSLWDNVSEDLLRKPKWNVTIPSNHLSIEPELTFQELVLRIPDVVSSCLYHKGKSGLQKSTGKLRSSSVFSQLLQAANAAVPTQGHEAPRVNCCNLHEAGLGWVYNTGHSLKHHQC